VNTWTLLRGTYGRLLAKILVLAFLMTSLYNVSTFSRSTQDAVIRERKDDAAAHHRGLGRALRGVVRLRGEHLAEEA
jgi:hypothetical protein